MRTFFFSMTPGFEPATATRIISGQSYVLDHNMPQQQWCIYQYHFLKIYINFFMRIIFVSYDHPMDSTNENQAYKRTVYQLEDHKVTLISTPSIIFFARIIFFMTPGFEPTRRP